MRKTYQPILNGKPCGSPVVGYNRALSRRAPIVRSHCHRYPCRPRVFNIVETPAVTQCCTCSEYCYCRLLEVRA